MRAQGTILIIDADHNTRVSLRNCFEKKGCFVVSAANGASALELLEEMTPPSLILLDMNMPVMDGEQFIGVIRSDPRFSAIPIVQMSEGPDLKRTGACCVIKKPIEISKLLDLIECC
jgi:CheY-like chemotaxis protein